MKKPAERFILVAGFADSLIDFRGHLMRSIVKTGMQTTAIVPQPVSGTTKRSLNSIGADAIVVPVNRTGINPIADVIYAIKLYSHFRSMRPKFVLAFTAKAVIFGMLAASIARVPYRFALITGLGYAFTSRRRGIVALSVRELYRIALRRSSKVFFQNPDDQQLFHDLKLLPPDVPGVVVNGSGIDLSAFPVTPLPEGSPVFLMVCRLLGDKGVREYARAAELVRCRFPDVRFQLAGWIDKKPDAISHAELNEWVSSGTIEFLGKLDDVRGALACCTVYVLPSYREGTPRTVLEAMATGRPIITCDAPGCRETVEDGKNGYLVPVGDAPSLAAAMAHFINDRSLAQRMGRRSREIAENRYDVNKVNAMMLREMGISPVAFGEAVE